MNQKLYIYTDASFNKLLEVGVAGWLILVDYENFDLGRDFSSRIRIEIFKETNNIRTEIMAVVLALEEVRKESRKEINLYTDCQTITHLLDRREKLEASNFTSHTKNKILSNVDLYKKFFTLNDVFQPNIHWIKGHSKKTHRTMEQKIFAVLDQVVRKELRAISR